MKRDSVKMGKVYSYIRFSSIRQREGQSVERQSRYAEVWAKEHGMTLDHELSMRDEGLSAFHQRHVKAGALGVFLKSVEDGKVEPGSVLIVEGLDRLSRAEPMEAQAQLSLIINAGVTVVTAADNKTYSRASIKNNPMDLIYSLLVMIRAHEESETKSKRAKSAIESQCQRWVAGTYRGVIRAGKDPAWVRWDGKQFVLNEAEAAKTRRTISLYLAGYGCFRIAQMLRAEGFPSACAVTSFNSLNNLLRKRPYLFIGTRIMEVNGAEYRLDGYYPPLISQDDYNRIIAEYRLPKRRGRAAEIPSILTCHNGIFRCGYCGRAMSVYREKAKKSDAFGPSRARCGGNRHGLECRTGSCLADPLERAVMAWCSDQMNLNSLIGKNQTADIGARLAASRARAAEAQKQLDRIIDAMLASDSPPAAFAARARAIETEIAALNHAIRADEAALMVEANKPTREAAAIWAESALAALAGDMDARIKVRKLVGETFEKIVLYRYGMNPPPIEETRGQKDKGWDLLLVSKSGVSRYLRINREGVVIAATIDDASRAR